MMLLKLVHTYLERNICGTETKAKTEINYINVRFVTSVQPMNIDGRIYSRISLINDKFYDDRTAEEMEQQIRKHSFM